MGANANTIITALRLGLNVVAAGHLGLDMYGTFMREVLQVRTWGCSRCMGAMRR